MRDAYGNGDGTNEELVLRAADEIVVHEVEVVNGGGTPRETRFAHDVVNVLGRNGTGGSDAHSAAGLGKGTTSFVGDIRHERDLIDAIRSGEFHAVQDFHVGRPVPYAKEPPAPS